MAEERDPRLSERYRELGAEEPPRHLDDAILAAARRRWRWYYPAAAAAVIVLAVGIAVQVERDGPDPDAAVLLRKPSTPAEERKAEKPAADAMLAKRRDERARAEAPASGARAPEAAARAYVEPPEKWLERIAELRKQSRHEEAEKALEAFRKRYPGYKLPESVLKK